MPSRVAIGRSPLVGPLARLERRERWCVALVSRRDARIFRGSPESLREVEQIHDVVFGQHDQGGWSQARYQRGIEKEKDDHLKHTAEVLMKHFKRSPFQRLILRRPARGGGGLRVEAPRLPLGAAGRPHRGGRGHRDPDKVLRKARPLLEELEEEREAAALERLGEGRAALWLDEVLQALNERRVECLLLDERFSAAGTACPECGLGRPRGRTHLPGGRPRASSSSTT